MTADSMLVINHDHTLQGLDIETSTYPALLEKSLSNGEKIPTLENYLLAGLGQTATKLIAEIKPSLHQVVEQVKDADKVFMDVSDDDIFQNWSFGRGELLRRVPSLVYSTSSTTSQVRQL